MVGEHATGAVARPVLAPSAYAPSLGGVEELTRQLAAERSRRGERPLVVTMRWPTDLPAAEVVEGVPLRRFVFRPPEGRLVERAVGAATGPVRVAQVAAALRAHRADLVHVVCVSAAAWHVSRAARWAGLPLVVTLQGELTMDADRAYERSPFLRRTLRDLLAGADAVTACSRHTLDEAADWSGLELGDRATVVPNGVRLADFAGVDPFAHPRPYLLAIGRHVHEKGFDVLVEAVSRLDGTPAAGLDLLVAGDGPERAALERAVAQRGLAGRVRFVGRADRPTAAALFRGATAFVLPSRHEPFGIVNLEAMAAGRPVVATAVGGVPEVVADGVTGVLVPPEDPEALAGALARVAADPAAAAAMGAAGAARARAFDWADVTDRYNEVYRRARRRAGAGPLVAVDAERSTPVPPVPSGAGRVG